MTYVYAYKRVNETMWHIRVNESMWHIAETTANMNECEFLRWLFDTANGHSKFDKIRILESY